MGQPLSVAMTNVYVKRKEKDEEKGRTFFFLFDEMNEWIEKKYIKFFFDLARKKILGSAACVFEIGYVSVVENQ